MGNACGNAGRNSGGSVAGNCFCCKEDDGSNGGGSGGGGSGNGSRTRWKKDAEKPFTDPSPGTDSNFTYGTPLECRPYSLFAVFPQDSSSYHIALGPRDSSGGPLQYASGGAAVPSTAAAAHVGGGSSPVGGLTALGGAGGVGGAPGGVGAREGSTSPSVAGDNNGGTSNSSRKGFVAGLMAPIGKSGSISSSECGAGSGSGGVNSVGGNGKPPSESKIQSLYGKYKDADEDAILSEGIEALCLDLELKPEEFKVLVLAWKCGAERMCRFSRQEFLRGCRSLRADSLKSLKQRLPEAVSELDADPGAFKDLYRFTFKFGLEGGQKALPVEMACSLWLLVFSLDEPPLLARWLEYLQDKDPVRQSSIKGIPRDTWNMFLNLVEAVGHGDLTSYDDTEAWPSLFDDFVEHENDAANQNVVVVSKKEAEEEQQQQQQREGEGEAEPGQPEQGEQEEDKSEATT